MPEYAFNPSCQRILIGQHYPIRDHDGIERPALITAAAIQEADRVALCSATFEDGRSTICAFPLSEDELAAWRRHPDTFFGVVGQRSTKAQAPLDFYDSCFEAFKFGSKDRLLQAMDTAADYDHLVTLTQPQLASIHAERMTIAALSNRAEEAPA